MGINMNRYMGYGLTDLQLADDGFTITDPRINVAELNKRNSKTGLDYKKYLLEEFGEPRQRIADVNKSIVFTDLIFMSDNDDELKRSNGYDWVHTDTTETYEDPKFYPIGLQEGFTALLIQPYAVAKSWTHFDDIIDLTALGNDRALRTEIVKLKFAQSPYNGFYSDSRNNKPVDKEIWSMVKSFKEQKSNPELSKFADKICYEKLGFENYEEAANKIVPTVPDEVIHLTNFLNLFSSSEIVHQLRPTIMTVWK